MSKSSTQLSPLPESAVDAKEEVVRDLAVEVYQQLHKIARSHMRRERDSHTLQPTGLVAEAYLRLFKGSPAAWRDQAHFYRTASRVMRHVLLDYARRRLTEKRGRGYFEVTFDESAHSRMKSGAPDLVALDRALTRLAALEPRLGQVVELRYFGGLDLEQTATALGCSTGTVKRDWVKAKLWLRRELAK